MAEKRKVWILGIFIVAAVIFVRGSQDGRSDKSERRTDKSEKMPEKKEEAKKRKDSTKKQEDEEIMLLADLVGAEVGDLSEECQVAAASVVLNRVHNAEFPDTVNDVIYQPGQYETVENGKIENAADETVRKNVKYVLENGSQIPENVVYQGMHPQGSGIWKIIDGEYFCYE